MFFEAYMNWMTLSLYNHGTEFWNGCRFKKSNKYNKNKKNVDVAKVTQQLTINMTFS